MQQSASGHPIPKILAGLGGRKWGERERGFQASVHPGTYQQNPQQRVMEMMNPSKKKKAKTPPTY